ncbi:MAG TPA: PH domain-containing protein [Spirochaetota bacterium]|nr:PH domain-containing protein [Spirochaetota bacterium]
MSYVDQNLMTGEQVVYKAKLHWVIFISPALLLILGLILFAANGTLGGIVTGLGVIGLIIAYLNVSTSEFAVTNKRVIIKVGIIKRNSLDTVLKKVESITVNQPIIGRMFGYGSIVVSGSGGTPQPFHKIANPLEFRKQVNEQVEKIG